MHCYAWVYTFVHLNAYLKNGKLHTYLTMNMYIFIYTTNNIKISSAE